MPVTLTRPDRLDADQAAAVRSLAAEVGRVDGSPPLSDAVLAQLRSPGLEHVLAVSGGDVVGYAQLADDSLELTGAPDSLETMLDAFADRAVLVWAHGRRSRIAPVLEQRRFTQTRGLLQLRRLLTSDDVAPDPPDGVRITAFRVGRDEDDWVRVNTAAFADHPEQGRWTRANIEAREAEDWFDPAGFLLAWRGDELLGYHWTKRHSADLGEVYVIGVDPGGQGIGLGRVLLAAGLAHLRSAGARDVLLYVDESNTGARRLYEQTGFTEHDRDTQWTSPVDQMGS